MMSHAVYRPATRFAILLGALVLPLSGVASAQEWAQNLFSEQSHDFGTVATGSECRHSIKITNNLRDDVHITGVRTSCSCASTKMPEKTVLRSHESTYIDIAMDTIRFMRDRNSNLIVSLMAGPPEAPQYAEVRIPVKVYIRTDVVLTPGEANFGAVEQGNAAERKIAIAYEGRADWQIGRVDVKENPYFEAKIVETFRDRISKVNYELVVALKPNAPLGVFRQQIALLTDDANAPRVPVLVQGRIEADVTVTPPIQTLGSMLPGDEKTVNFVVRGHKPFKIEKIEVDSSRQNCKMVMPKDSRPVHVLPITIAAPKEDGEWIEQFTLTIEGRKEPITFTARGKTIATAAKVETN